MTMVNPNSNPKPEKASDEVKKEFLRPHYRINSCYTSKKDVELELQKLEIKYCNANLLLSNNPNDTTKHEIARLRRRISRMVDAKCSLCGKRIVAPSSSYRKYEYYIECFECTCELERVGHEEYRNKWRKEAEINPLIKYCYGINKRLEPYNHELSLTTKEQLLKLNEERYVIRIIQDDKFTETERLNSADKPYDSLFGMSKHEWERQIKDSKRLYKQERKLDVDSDRNLRHNSPTWQILNKLNVLYAYGCTCELEYMRQGQVCPVCRLMPKIYDHTLNLFKEAAQGRVSGI